MMPYIIHRRRIPRTRHEADMKKIIGTALVLLALGACNTVDGVGGDISGAAVTVQGWF